MRSRALVRRPVVRGGQWSGGALVRDACVLTMRARGVPVRASGYVPGAASERGDHVGLPGRFEQRGQRAEVWSALAPLAGMD